MITYYDCREDPEYLSCEDVCEAVQMWADDLDPDTPLPETVTVYHYRREAIPAQVAEHKAEWILEALLESLDEEYGPPDEATEPTTAQTFIVRGLIEAFIATYRVWRCKRVGSHTARVRDYVKDGPEFTDDEGHA